jgi:serine/threonine-protein kinase
MAEAEENAGQLGRYTLVRRIGKGGMGEVWLAKVTGAHGFEKNVALKRILPQFSSNPHVVNMLVDEARISVLLNHPNVVQVLELGEEEGEYFIAMEYVDGHALSRLLRRLKKAGRKLEVLECCFIVIQLLEGLHAAHVQKDHRGKPAGIIHRDVSPQNVLLSMDGQVKVIDFGIARARERLEVTQGSSVKGKLRYMAPEQLSPKLLKGKPIDHRVDVFAAGIVLFEALANRLRFPGDGEIEIMDAILKEDTPDLVKEGLVDRELMDILDTALEKDREHRFKDAASFAAALRSYLYKRDPGFTAERLARKMREAFGGEEVDEKERSAERSSPAKPSRGERERTSRDQRIRSLSSSSPLHGREARSNADDDDAQEQDVDATRTAFRPRVRADERAGLRGDARSETGVTGSAANAGTVVRGKRKKSRAPAVAAGVVLGGALLAAGFLFVVKPRLAGGADTPPPVVTPVTPPDGPVVKAPDTPVVVPPPTPAPPPSTASKDGVIDLLVEAEPATTRISLAAQPDPKYVSPAHIKLRRGEDVELVFEADGFDTERRRFVVSDDLPPLRVQLHPLPVDLVLRVVPRDAVVTVDGQPAKPGMKVIPGQNVEVRAEHPFASAPRIVQGVPVPGQPYVVEIKLDEVDQAVKGTHVARGKLSLTSKPKGADVYVDGTLLKDSTPLEVPLMAGQHRVVVRAKTGEQTFTVDIKDGETLKREAILE